MVIDGWHGLARYGMSTGIELMVSIEIGSACRNFVCCGVRLGSDPIFRFINLSIHYRLYQIN